MLCGIYKAGGLGFILSKLCFVSFLGLKCVQVAILLGKIT